jgi:hypothetical protein
LASVTIKFLASPKRANASIATESGSLEPRSKYLAGAPPRALSSMPAAGANLDCLWSVASGHFRSGAR